MRVKLSADRGETWETIVDAGTFKVVRQDDYVVALEVWGLDKKGDVRTVEVVLTRSELATIARAKEGR